MQRPSSSLNRIRWDFTYIASLAGFFISIFLTEGYLGFLSIPCGINGDCEQVRLSPLGHFFGIPTPIFGSLFYGVLASYSALRLSGKDFHWDQFFDIIVVVGLLFSVGLTSYSFIELHATCPWCLASNGCIAAIAFLTCNRNSNASTMSWSVARVLVPLFLLSMACLTVSVVAFHATHIDQSLNTQALYEMPEAELAPVSRMLVMEKPKETRTLVAFADLECPFCRGELPELIHLSNAGKFNLIVRFFPLQTHQLARRSALAALAAGFKFRAKEFIEFRCINGDQLTLDQQLAHFGVNYAQNLHRAEDLLAEDLKTANRLNIREVPTLILLTSHKREFIDAGGLGKLIGHRS